jgi:tetratricopeptide (TPR) repeat protein
MFFRKKTKDEPPGKKLWETYFKELLKKNLQKALESLKKLKELEPDNSQVHLKMGDILQRMGDESGAIEAYNEAANCLVSEAHQEKAVAIYKIILRIDPKNSDAKNKMEEVVAYLGSLGTEDSPVVAVGIEEIPVHEAETEAPEAAPEAETVGVSEDVWPSGEAEAEAGEAPPEAETGGVSEEAWPSGEAEVGAGEAQQSETEMEDLPAEDWMIGEAEAGAGEVPPETGAVGVSEDAWPSGEAATPEATPEAAPEEETVELSLDDEIDALISQLGVEDSVDENPEECSTILSALGAKETDTLLKKAKHRTFTHGEKVVEEGETGDSMFVIKYGEARVVSNVLGKDIELAKLKGGEIFGEMVFLSGRPRTASVIAESDLEVLEVSSELLQEVVENNPEVQDRIAEFFYSRVQDTMNKVKGQ